MRAFALLAAAPLALAAIPAPASAQDLTAPGGERVNTIIIYGDDPCPAAQGEEITVCARKPEAERYRIPAPLREPSSTRSEAWNEKVLAYETVGRTGTNSCKWLTRSAVCAKYIVGRDPAAAKTTVHSLTLNRFIANLRRRKSVIDPARH